MSEKYARVEDGLVVAIHVVADEVVADGGESAGYELLNQLHGGDWVRFSRTGEFRYNKAGIGFTYDEELDAFIPPKPFESWVLNEDTCLWDAPIPYPTDGQDYIWDEQAGDWIAV